MAMAFDAAEAQLRALANGLSAAINGQGGF
jgi:hypothetical protein